MSWLFDQLSCLAGADSVGVVIAADTWPHARAAGSIDMAELLVRASALPTLSILLLPARLTDPTLRPEEREELDLGELNPNKRVGATRRMLHKHRAHCGAVLRLQSTRLCLEPYGRLPDRTTPNQDFDTPVRWMLAIDQAEYDIGFDDLDIDEPKRGGLRVAIGGMSANADVSVDDQDGCLALLDALVSLREVACQPGDPEVHPGDWRSNRGALR